jgi:hypothetical protein
VPAYWEKDNADTVTRVYSKVGLIGGKAKDRIDFNKDKSRNHP